jgi:hypothetical protein
LVGSNGAGRPDERPTEELPPLSRDEGRPLAEAATAGETYTLIDADGAVSEIADPDALRANFEQMLFDKHLSAGQITGVWESNEPARQAIERLFGAGALTQAQEHLHSLRGVRYPLGDDQQEPAAPSHIEAVSRECTGQDRLLEPDQALVLEINPAWGVQKIFQQYRAALNALSDNRARSKPAIAKFRGANIAVEQRLRVKLPSRMREIEAIYQRAGLEP